MHLDHRRHPARNEQLEWPLFMVGYLFVLAYMAAGATYWTAVALGL